MGKTFAYIRSKRKVSKISNTTSIVPVCNAQKRARQNPCVRNASGYGLNVCGVRENSQFAVIVVVLVKYRSRNLFGFNIAIGPVNVATWAFVQK